MLTRLAKKILYIEILEFREYEIWLQVAFFIRRMADLNPIKGDISDSQLNAVGGQFWPPSRNLWKSAARSHIAKSYFKSYKLYDHMQNIKARISKIQWDIEVWKFWDYVILSYLGLRKLP